MNLLSRIISKIKALLTPKVSSFDALLKAIELDCPPVHIRPWNSSKSEKWGESLDQVIKIDWVSLDQKKRITMAYRLDKSDDRFLKKEQAELLINGVEYIDTWNNSGVKIRDCLLRILRKHDLQEKELLNRQMEECVVEIFKKRETILLKELDKLHLAQKENANNCCEPLSNRKQLA